MNLVESQGAADPAQKGGACQTWTLWAIVPATMLAGMVAPCEVRVWVALAMVKCQTGSLS